MTQHHIEVTETAYRQFPLRLPAYMADELDSIAKRTRINKTTISRIAIEKIIREIKIARADRLLDEVLSV